MDLSTIESFSHQDWQELARHALAGTETRLFIDGDYCDAAAGGRFATVNPANGSECAWIPAEYAEIAEQAGLTTWDAAGYMVLHLSSVLRKNAAEFVGIQEVQNMLEQLEQAVRVEWYKGMVALEHAGCRVCERWRNGFRQR